MFDFILSIFFPRTCYSCGEVGSYLCEICDVRRVTRKISHECHVCKKPTEKLELTHKKCREKSSLDGVFVSLKYDKFIEHLIAEFKYEFVLDLKNLLSYFLIEHFRNSGFYSSNFSVTFVPLHKNRERWRGYNQSKKLGEIFASRLNLRFENLLERIKFSKSQVGLRRSERLKNVRDAFVLKMKPESKKILIIDDVMTTGATLEECAKVLKEGGAEEVYGLVIARG